MIIHNPSEDFKYGIGKYSITKSEPNEWHLYHKEQHVAIFFDRDEVLRHAIIQHTCGDMVAEGLREMMEIALLEQNLT